MATLIGMSGEFKDQRYPVETPEVTIGRKSDNRVVIDNPTISSHHCRIIREGDAYLLEDLDSTNGTRVNSRDIQQTRLHPKDLLQFGSLEFLFDAPELASTAPDRYTDADIELTTGGMTAPTDFASISPFGSRPKERRGTWYMVLALSGIAALAALIFYLILLFSNT